MYLLNTVPRRAQKRLEALAVHAQQLEPRLPVGTPGRSDKEQPLAISGDLRFINMGMVYRKQFSFTSRLSVVTDQFAVGW